MWELHNQTSFLAERTFVVDKDGARHWVVVVKGTFDILPDGSTVLSEEPLPVMAAPEYNGEDGVSSLRYESDLAADKPGTDIIVNGKAFAPNGRPVTRVSVGLQTPLGNKALTVHGDRVWERSAVGQLQPSMPLPFVEMPLVYERAFGGFDQQDPDPDNHRLDDRNPVGTGFYTSRAHRRDQLLPNVEYVNEPPSTAPPPGYGVVSPHWLPRRPLWGTYDAAWLEKRKPLLPKDFDPRALLCAPADQQAIPHLRGGESFGVVNMNPQGNVRFTLPKHYFGFTTYIGGTKKEHRAKISTVILEPEYPRVIVVWHTSLACHKEIDDIDFTHIAEKRFV